MPSPLTDRVIAKGRERKIREAVAFYRLNFETARPAFEVIFEIVETHLKLCTGSPPDVRRWLTQTYYYQISLNDHSSILFTASPSDVRRWLTQTYYYQISLNDHSSILFTASPSDVRRRLRLAGATQLSIGLRPWYKLRPQQGESLLHAYLLPKLISTKTFSTVVFTQ